MAEAPAGQHEHRGVRAVQRMVEYAPSSGGLALWVGHRDLPATDGPGAPVHTDGLTLHYAPAFATLPVELQAGWVAHEVLHIALRHAQRYEDLRRRLGDVDLQLFNRCADAIVNSALAPVRWLALPAGAIRLEAVLDEVLGERADAEAALLAWDVERLYLAVDDRRAAASGQGKTERRAKGGQDRGDRGERGGHADAQAPRDEPGAARHDGPRAARMRTLGSPEHDDLRPAPGGSDPLDEAEQAREWLERLLRAQADDGETSMLRTLLADLPRVRTPWELVLRAQAARALARRPGTSWSRPSRSWLANQGRDRRGRRMPWAPGTTASRAVPRLALVVDVSGSIDDGLLQRFAREVEAIVRRQEAPLVLVAGDMQVRLVQHLKPGESVLDALTFEGGGGTDFAPLLAEAMRHAPDLVVVLTDLEGPAGAPPRCPVIWAVPATSATVDVPFGRRLVLE